MSTMNIGEEGFWWFIGIVEDRDDPLNLGRVRVRVHNIHSTKKTISPTENLPWATPMMPITSASSGGVGVSPTGIRVGTTVFGFFIDGRSAQNPVIMGTMPGIIDGDMQKHDVMPEARGINKIQKTRVEGSPEPATAYAAKYPHNKVMKTESGHAVEIDDTPGAERIHIFHKSGTYVEIDRAGQLVVKTVGNKFDVVVGNESVYVGGNATVEVKGNININVAGNADVKIGGTATVESGGAMTLKAPTTTIDSTVTITGDTTIKGTLSAMGSGGAGVTGTLRAAQIECPLTIGNLQGTADVAQIAHAIG